MKKKTFYVILFLLILFLGSMFIYVHYIEPQLLNSAIFFLKEIIYQFLNDINFLYAQAYNNISTTLSILNIILLLLVCFILIVNENKVWDRWPIYIYLIVCAVIVWIDVLYILKFNNNIDIDFKNAQMMLSSLVQIEALIFSLIITFSLISVQLASSSYSVRVIDVFKRSPDSKILILLYGFDLLSIIILLAILKEDNFDKLESLMILISTIGIISVIGSLFFMKNTLDLIKPSTIIEKLSRDLTFDSIIISEQIGDESDLFQPINDILTRSLLSNDTGTFLNGIRIVSSRIKYLANKSKSDKYNDNQLDKIQKRLFTSLTALGELTLQEKNETATEHLVRSLGELGLEFCTNNLPKFYNKTLILIEEIGSKSACMNIDSPVNCAIYQIGIIGAEAVKKDDFEASIRALSSLGDLGTRSVECKLSESAMQSIMSINRIKSATNLEIITVGDKKKNFESIFSLIASSLKKIGYKAHDTGMVEIRDIVVTELDYLIIKSDSEGWAELSSNCKNWIRDLKSSATK